MHKYANLKGVLIERRGLTIPERVNKVISGEQLGSDISSRFLRRLQKTAGFGTSAVVWEAVICQALIRQMPVSIRAHLATQSDSASLENLADLADRALASENDAKGIQAGVAEIQVSQIAKLIGLLEELSRRLKKLESSSAKKKHYSHKQSAENREHKQTVLPDVNAKPFIPNVSQDNRQGVFPATHQVHRPAVPPLTKQQNDAAQPTDTANAPVCYYH